MSYNARIGETPRDPSAPGGPHLIPPPDDGAGYLLAPNHSTLEVVPGPDYDKEAIRGRDYDKQVVPNVDDKEVVQHLYLPPNTPAKSGVPWWGGDGSTVVPRRTKILGLKKRTFFIVLWIVILVVAAIAAGLGAGLGITKSSANSGGQTDSVAAFPSVTQLEESSAADPSTSLTLGTLPSDTSNFATSTGSTRSSGSAPPPSSSAPPPSPTSSSAPPLSTATFKYGGVGGRCTNRWGSDCICLEEGICRDRWKGQPYTGYEGNWPCPDDADNVMACVVKPCLGQVDPAQCLWKEACRQLAPAGTGSGAPICPGDGDFVCCAHSW
ncbi:hypothetical protein QBC35DRAFT_503957 [Podospora australis]|uniref:Uncharacterized protein n=1 Tax=Podospora australis TaxID=1536484 RepID=A0AAN7AGR7_9PEZI|nr:hypothetical protein QBC35DRAFT_503957 [Podospora australis]